MQIPNKTGTEKIITKIDANPNLSLKSRENRILKVAAYCRVSTDSDDQLESYKAQMSYYTEAIAKNPNWRLAGIYADEGITGTSTKKREDFMRMIRDCEKGKIDLILTKSVARFARNTVDSLNYVRKLKAMGIGVFFEEQNLDSLKADSEMFIGLHSVMAQAESENISANVRWGIQQRMKTGTYAFRYNILGYVKGADGKPQIVPEQAEIVRTIYDMYLGGASIDQIKTFLEREHYLTLHGKSEWSRALIKNILVNERYCGDLLLQKTYVENCITKKTKKNMGELPKYLITNNHEPIVTREVFKAVQAEMARRANKRKSSDFAITENGKYSGKYALTGKLICGECGGQYRRKIWTYKGEKRAVWRCLSRIEHGKKVCHKSPTLDEIKLKEAINRAFGKCLKDGNDIKNLILSNLSYGITGTQDPLDIATMQRQLNALDTKLEETVALSQKSGGDPQKLMNVVSELCRQMTVLRERIDAAKANVEADSNLNFEIKRITELLENSTTTEFDDSAIRMLVEAIRVMTDGKIQIELKTGETIIEALDPTDDEM